MSYKAIIHNIFNYVGFDNVSAYYASSFSIFLCVLALAWLAGFLCRRVFVPIIERIVKKTDFVWDDYLLNHSMMIGFCRIVPPVIIYWCVPWIFQPYKHELAPDVQLVFLRGLNVYIIIMVVRLILIFLKNISVVFNEHETLQKHYVTGLFQFLKLAVVLVSVIIAISVLLDRSPFHFIAGLGAAATVLMFVFKDTILGLVAGIQLSVNGMLRIHDWVTIPKVGADGYVEEISLTTVKIRNFDNTITTVPPYTLVSDSFQNWRGMSESEGRRVKRSFFIDIETVRFCDEKQLEYLENHRFLPERNNDEKVINLTLFRRYMKEYLRQSSLVNNGMTLVIRQLQPTPQGIPIEFYFFLKEKNFILFEEQMADLLEFMLAILPEFGLHCFQSPSGRDLDRLRKENALYSN